MAPEYDPTPKMVTIGEARARASLLLLPQRLGRPSLGTEVAAFIPGPRSRYRQILGRETSLVKTMTCKQLGGPCEFAHHGATADEVIKAQDSHLKQMVESGDDSHQDALKDMKGRWKRPISGMGWYRNTKREFAALPED
jgi:hypothetical protein